MLLLIVKDFGAVLDNTKKCYKGWDEEESNQQVQAT